MKSLNLLVLAAALFIALPASAQQVKPYHQNIKDCAACHTKENAVAGNQFVTPDNKACLTCHQSYAAVAEKTKNLKNGEPNPHASHHYGEGKIIFFRCLYGLPLRAQDFSGLLQQLPRIQISD